MAQLVERVLGKDEVGGSNPPSSSKGHPSWCPFFFIVNRRRVGMRTLRYSVVSLLTNPPSSSKGHPSWCPFLFYRKPTKDDMSTLRYSVAQLSQRIPEKMSFCIVKPLQVQTITKKNRNAFFTFRFLIFYAIILRILRHGIHE